MSETRTTLVLSAGLGLIAGMRSMSAPALLSRHLAGRPARGRGRALRLLATRRTANVLTALAAAEMVADKTPVVPDRTEPPALLGRIAMGALSGAAVAAWRGDPALGAALVGGVAAAAATHLAYTLRREAGRATGVPDPLLGLAEDALVVIAGSSLATAVVA